MGYKIAAVPQEGALVKLLEPSGRGEILSVDAYLPDHNFWYGTIYDHGFDDSRAAFFKYTEQGYYEEVPEP